jgi:2-oxoglutarate ferredoxin oxidoreductase subunit alpha
VLTNKELGMTRETVDLESIELPERVERRRVPPDQSPYLPHAFSSPEEVPAISDFGGPHVARFTTSTHDQAAYLTTDPETIQQMVDHYRAKIEAVADDVTLAKADLEAGSEVLLVSYGIVSRSVAVAVRELRARGGKVSSLVLQTLWPVPEKLIRSAMAGVRRVVVPEMNLGQYVLEIERLAPSETQVVRVGKMNTRLLSPAEILERGELL